MACEWIVNSMAILRGEKRSEKTRVEQPDSLLNFDMAINHGDYNRERRGEGEWETKDASPSSSSSSPSHYQKATTVQGQEVKEQECPTANNNNKIDSFVVRRYLNIPPVFETIPRTLALFVSVVISLVKRVGEEHNS